MSTPTHRDIEALIELFDRSDWKELDLRIGEFELFLGKDSSRRRTLAGGSEPVFRSSHSDPPPRAGEGVSREQAPAHWLAVRAPNLGTFYRAPKPGAPPFVELNQSVSADTEICLIEVMKLFTAVRAGVAGLVRRMEVQDGEMVEHDQVLLYLEPI